MSAVDETSGDDGTVKDRLVRAADSEVAAHEVTGPGGEHVSRAMEVQDAVKVAIEALHHLSDQLRRDH